MKVILLSNIEKVGHKGDVVNVKRGFARNYLVPRNFAIYATPSNMARLGSIQTKAAEEEAQRVAEFQRIAGQLSSKLLTFVRKVDEHDHMFGSVSESDISATLAEQGMNIHKSLIHMEKHIKELGASSVTIRLHKDVQATLNIVVEKEGGSQQSQVEAPITEPALEAEAPGELPVVEDSVSELPVDEASEMPAPEVTEAVEDITSEDNTEL